MSLFMFIGNVLIQFLHFIFSYILAPELQLTLAANLAMVVCLYWDDNTPIVPYYYTYSQPGLQKINNIMTPVEIKFAHWRNLKNASFQAQRKLLNHHCFTLLDIFPFYICHLCFEQQWRDYLLSFQYNKSSK